MRLFRRLFLLLLALLVSSIPALAVNSGHIQGYVLDGNGEPIEGAVVTVSGEDAVGTWHCHSNARGFYRIAGLDASRSLTIHVDSPERLSVTRAGYRLRNDQTLRLNFHLRTAGSRRVFVILDDTVAYHRMALRGALATLPDSTRVFEISDGSPATTRRLKSALEERPDGIIAIGPLAARLALGTTFDIPVVHALVPNPVGRGLSVANMCGVPANGAFDEQMALLRSTLPEVRKIGVLHVPQRLARALAALEEAAAAHGIEIEARSLHHRRDLDRQLASLAAEEIDGILLFLDPVLSSAGIISSVGEFARRRGLLLMVPDPELLAEPGAISYVVGVEELGAFAGGILNNILSRRTTASAVGLSFPPAGIHALSLEEIEQIQTVREIMQARLRR